MVSLPWLTFAVNFGVLPPALTRIPFARFLFELEKPRPFGKAIVIVLSAAALLPAASVNESFALPFPTPESEACDADVEVLPVWVLPVCVVPEDGDDDLLTGTGVPGEVGLNVAS